MTPKTNLKKILQYLVPPIITAGLCIFLYRDVNWEDVAGGLRSCNFALIGAFLGCNILAQAARALRWRLQLRAIGVTPRFGEMLRSIFGTYAVNLVFPRLGEFWRCSYIARVASAPFSGVFGSMVADRLADTLAVMLLALTTFLVTSKAMLRFMAESNLDSTASTVLTSPWVIGAIVLLIGFALLCRYGRGRLFRRLREIARNVWTGFAAVFSMKGRGPWLLLTLGIWGSYFGGMILSLLAYPPTASLLADGGVLIPALVTFVFGSLAMAIPSNGGIGPWQVSVILSLSGIYGLDRADALTFATINLAFTTLLTIALGLYTFIAIALKKR